MANLVISGDTSGSVTLSAPAEAGTTVLTLPTTSGTLIVSGGAQTIEFADGTVSAPSITNSGDTNTGIYFPAADTIAFTEGGAERMRLDSSGNLGLGVTPSAWSGVVASQVGVASISGSAGAEFVRVNSNAYYDGTNFRYIISSNNASSYRQITGIHAWFTAPSGTAGNTVTFTQAMTLDASGNLGIGTSSPTVPLHVVSASTPRIYLGSDASKFSGIVYTAGTTYGSVAIRGQGNDTGTVVHVDRDNSQVRFDTSGSERMRIASGGTLLVGTTTVASGASVQASFINANGGGIQFGLPTNGGGALVGNATGGILFFGYSGAQGSEGYSERARIDSSGNLLVGTTTTGPTNTNSFTMEVANKVLRVSHSGTGNTSAYVAFDYNGNRTGWIEQNSTTSVAYNTTSDYRLKTDVQQITNGLEKVLSLNPVYFNWLDGTPSEGFIAHELQNIVPSAVSGGKDAVNEDGTIKAQGVDYSKLVATLTAAIQELNAKVTALEAQLGAK
jgi:hypothetical protein